MKPKQELDEILDKLSGIDPENMDEPSKECVEDPRQVKAKLSDGLIDRTVEIIRELGGKDDDLYFRDIMKQLLPLKISSEKKSN